MRKAWRILLYALTALSAVLCVAMICLWVRGYWVTDRFMTTHVRGNGAAIEFRNLDLISKRGYIGAYITRFLSDGSLPDAVYLLQLADPVERTGWKYIMNAEMGWPFKVDAPIWKSLQWERGEGRVRRGSVETGITVELADWIVVGIFGVLPAAMIRRWRRFASRWSQGLCQTCAYDVRATPDRCPECGTVPTAQPARPAGPVDPRGSAVADRCRRRISF